MRQALPVTAPAARNMSRVAGGFGGVLASGGGGPADCPVGELAGVPAGVLFEPVVAAAFWAGVAQAGPAARLVGGAVLVVALGRGPAADGAGARGVPDPGQVAEPGAGVVAGGLEAVVAVLGGEGAEGDEVLPAVDGEGPGAGAAGRTVAAGAGEAEGGLRPVPVPGGSRKPGAAVPGAFPVALAALGLRSGAGVPGGVPVVVSGGHAPGGLRVRGGRAGQVPGEPGVDGDAA
jgi:hypothetical protein